MLEKHSKETDPEIELQIDWDLLQRVYGNETPSCLFTLVMAGVLAAVVATYAPGAWLPLAWWLAMASIIAVRAGTAARFRTRASPETAGVWRRRHALNITASGCVWGLGGALMFLAAPYPHSQAAVLVVVAVMTAAAVAYQGIILRAYLGYLLAAIIPLTIASAVNPAGGTMDIALLSLVYCGAMWMVASRYNRDQRTGLRLGREMQGLSQELAEANRKLEADIDARLRAENLLSIERNVLENVARQMPLNRILDELNLDVEALFPGSLCSVLLLDPDTARVRHASAPHLPETFVEAVDGLPIGPSAGSCGTAMYHNRQVITEDIANDHLWRDYRDLATTHDLRACWSTPIVSRSGHVLGSFAVYRCEPASPAAEELETVNRMSRLIALVTEDIQNSEKILLSEQRFRDFANAAADWFWEMDAELVYTFVSKKTGEGASDAQQLIMDQTRVELAARRDEALDTPASRAAVDAPGKDRDLVFEFSVQSEETGRMEVLTVARPLHDGDGRITGWRGVGRDITRERRLEREIRYQAAHDSLTGLVNRREFETRIREVLARGATDSNAYVAFIDLDDFKRINDNAGHPAGDAVLKRVADTLKDAIPGERTVARLGGDEFGACFLAEDSDAAVGTMERVLRDLDKTRFEWGNTDFRLGASVGVVRISPMYKTTAQVLSDADICCYRAKNQGGNRVSLFRPDLDLFTDDAHSSSELIRALKDQRAAIHAQPIRRLRQAGDMPWYEVLLRCNDYGDPPSSLSRLIPAAERRGRMGVVDTWVLEQALSWWGGLLAQGVLRLSLNLSVSSMMNRETANEITRLVEQAHLSPGALCFEITETSILESLEGAARFMRDLRGLGCGFVIDNFGSGQSNFSYLKALPGDYLAIHGGYVRSMTRDPADFAIVDAIHKVGRAHGMRTLAKFVESKQVLDALVDLGIDYGQGYYLGEAVPASEVELPAVADPASAGESSL